MTTATVLVCAVGIGNAGNGDRGMRKLGTIGQGRGQCRGKGQVPEILRIGTGRWDHRQHAIAKKDIKDRGSAFAIFIDGGIGIALEKSCGGNGPCKTGVTRRKRDIPRVIAAGEIAACQKRSQKSDVARRGKLAPVIRHPFGLGKETIRLRGQQLIPGEILPR